MTHSDTIRSGVIFADYHADFGKTLPPRSPVFLIQVSALLMAKPSFGLFHLAEGFYCLALELRPALQKPITCAAGAGLQSLLLPSIINPSMQTEEGPVQ